MNRFSIRLPSPGRDRYDVSMKILPYFLVFTLSVVSSVSDAKPAAGYEGMVSTAHPAATQAGVAMLRQGGNAADAAAAAAFTLAVAEPYSSGIGGGGFALTSFKGAQAFLDFREVAPSGAHRDMYVVEGAPDKRLSRDGVLSVGVPGAVAGYLELHKRWGVLSRAQIIKPAIALAREGFKVTPRYVAYVNRRLEVLRRDPEMCRVFLVPSTEGEGHVAPPVGHRLRQPDLARTLKLIAQKGAQVFYTGAIARRLVADMGARGGLINARDLNAYRVRDRQPLVGSYRGHAIVSSPPPSSGGQILLTLLNIMETLPPDTPWRSLEALHLYIEGSKRAFADRALLGDPLFVPYLDALLPNLLTKDRARLIAKIITPAATSATSIPAAQGSQVPPGLHTDIFGPQSTGRDTTHLSVLDKHGGAVSMTTTINTGWGSGVVARDTGVVWNNEMDDFAIAPGVPNAYGIVGSEANAVQPGKTPLSSMSPTLVFAGPTTASPIRWVLGSPGGSRIPTTVAQAILHLIDHQADIQTALSLGRVHHQHLPDTVFVEEFTLSAPVLEALRARGHEIKVRGRWSNATAIAVDPDTGLVTGAADPRGIGTALAE